MKDGVSKIEVFDFKENWCSENKTIAKLIREKVSKYFVAPILDVGAGLGDIAYNAFPEKETICIDVNKIAEGEFPISKNHKRKQIDFFDYKPSKQIKTVFISHTLQFIDEDADKLNKKIKEINPDFVIMVLNDNNDFMGELIDWTEANFENANPEIHLSGFPKGYSMKKRIPFKAKLHCPDFDKLAKQIGYLMVVDLKESAEQLKEFLKAKLNNKAEFSFKQSIQIYQRNGG
ncbi:MAG: hypothetical protein AAB638_04060 [Patescibacteria group bacterium]|mgnify:CR=1 FL=1